MSLEIPLWRAVALFRVAALGYAAILMANNYPSYPRPWLGWLVIVGMAAWTAATAWAYAEPARRRWPLLLLDLAVAGAFQLASRWVIDLHALDQGAPTLPMAWVAGPVLAWAIWRGRRLGAVAALAMGAVDGVNRGFTNSVTLNGTVLLLLAGVITGYMARLAVAAEDRVQRATELEASNRERERLARSIHDSVLQVLALVQRRGMELGGEAAELGLLAGEQGATLRALVGVGSVAATSASGAVDLRALVNRHASGMVSVGAPATPVWLPAPVAAEVLAAVGAALDNVRVHAGPGVRAWVLVEDEEPAVTVTVRDDGVGMPPSRLAMAEAAGRLGVAQSIKGRIRDMAGTVTITTAPGAGTEVEMRIPRQPSLGRERKAAPVIPMNQ
jgi:signal transduction histidine kinase